MNRLDDTYSQCLNEMYSLRRFGIQLGLDTMKIGLSQLGNPHLNYNTIHIAGTNGKGSIASGLASILRQAGYKVGLYTSPHLVSFNERIQVNGSHISNDDVISAYHSVRQIDYKDREPTFFEIVTAMAFYHFNRMKVEWVIIETGMGGRLDATNIINPKVSIISNVSIEHTTYLGKTIEKIAYEKAGIIKPNTPVVTGIKQKSAIQVLETISKQLNSPLYQLGKSFRVRRSQKGFNYSGIHHEWRDMHTNLSGDYQIHNAALVLAACELLNEQSLSLSIEDIRYGLSHTYWPGRLHLYSSSPYILIDGAHNLDAAKALSKHLSTYLKDRKIVLVIGILDDKPYKIMLEYIVPLCAHVIITRPQNERGLDPRIIFDIAKNLTTHVEIQPTVDRAIQQALTLANEQSAICISGSLFVVGEALAYLEKVQNNKTQG